MKAAWLFLPALLPALACGAPARSGASAPAAQPDGGATAIDSGAPEATAPATNPAFDATATAPDSVDATAPSPAAADAHVTPVPFPTLPSARPGGIESGHPWGNVFNGSVFESATLHLPATARLVVPTKTVVASGGKPGAAELYLEKNLSFAGHPPTAMPIAGLRRNMGIAMKADGDALVIATFGEWGSIEGGARLDLLVRVPDGVVVVRRVGLEGATSEAAMWDPETPAATVEAGQIGYWYTAPNPRPGWKRVVTKRDDRRVVRAFSHAK